MRPFSLVLALVVLAGSVPGPQSFAAPEGVTEWVAVAGGRLKARLFVSPEATAHPVLVVALHGDAPFNKPDYQYVFAARAAASGDVVAAAILRPGYSDPVGDRSSGERGLTTGDNYTPERIEMIAQAIRALQAERRPSRTILVGHSGGAVIAADLMALHPDMARDVLLASCPCDVAAWRWHMIAVSPTPMWALPVRSLSPIDLASRVSPSARIVMMVGAEDRTAPVRFTEAYAAALARRGIKADVVQLPGKGHEIFLEPEVLGRLKAMIGAGR